jgi:CBS domain-containing protein
VAVILVEHRISGIPVCDAERRVLGVVSEGRRTPWLKRGDIDMAVERGQVALHGRLPALSDARVVERLAARVPGVVSVRSELTWSVDDSGREAMRATGGS